MQHEQLNYYLEAGVAVCVHCRARKQGANALPFIDIAIDIAIAIAIAIDIAIAIAIVEIVVVAVVVVEIEIEVVGIERNGRIWRKDTRRNCIYNF